jgi:hypothetical protein
MNLVDGPLEIETTMGRFAWCPLHNRHLVHPLLAGLVPLSLSEDILFGVPRPPCFHTSLRAWPPINVMVWFTIVEA